MAGEELSGFSRWVTDVFGPLLKPIFHPMDEVLANIYMPWAKVAALSLFLGTMLWVILLKPQYVNLDAPEGKWWCDLRLWTVISMSPHIVVYLYF